MSIIAGAISRNGRALPDWLRDSLTGNLSRIPSDSPEVVSGTDWMLAKVDVGAFRSNATFTAPDGSALMLAGEPLLSGPRYVECQNREQETRILFQDLDAGNNTALMASTGAFCAAYYSSRNRQLTLVADKLGLRPIYYLITPEFAAFTSAMRVFEAARLAYGDVDLRGTYETCAFGFPLGTRTCYAGIRTIGAAELVSITASSEAHIDYFRWDRLDRTDDDENRLIRELGTTFDSAVSRRLRRDRTALAFLSGGLDSRTIVATLIAHNVSVNTVNFAPPQTQDRVFGALIANSLGTKHRQLDAPQSSATDVYRQELLTQWVDSLGPSEQQPERPRCIWSGDGGSVALGHVYLDDQSVENFENGNREAGVRAFLRYNKVSGASNRAMAADLRRQSGEWHLDGVREELSRLDGPSDGRALHLFLMLNDQRRHMAAHFENMDKNRFEFLMPFFDSDFLEVILRAPVKPFLRHRLYHEWLQAAHPAAASVPWQTYPNHEPCPVPFKEQLRYQFVDYHDWTEVRRIARRQGRNALAALRGHPFPHHLIDRLPYLAAIGTCLLGNNSYSHIVRVGQTFVSHWQRSRDAPSHAFTPAQGAGTGDGDRAS